MDRDMEALSGQILDLVILTQTNELKYLAESWHNWGVDEHNTEVGWRDMYQEFSYKMTTGRSGPEGERIAVSFLSNEDGTITPIQASDRGLPWIEELGVYAAQTNDYLHPRYIITGEETRIFWNKLVVPTPTSSNLKLVVFYGFCEEALFNSVSTRYGDVTMNANQIADNNQSTFYAISVLMVSVVVLGMIIAINLRQMEGGGANQ